MPQSINIRFPFEETQDGGVFATNTTTERAYRDDMTALLTLKRGQRPMRSQMYSPIFDYLHEPLDEPNQRMLERDIIEKVGEYVPQVTIKKVKFSPKPEENYLGIKIIFTVNDLFEIEQTLELNVPLPEGQSL